MRYHPVISVLDHIRAGYHPASIMLKFALDSHDLARYLAPAQFCPAPGKGAGYWMPVFHRLRHMGV